MTCKIFHCVHNKCVLWIFWDFDLGNAGLRWADTYNHYYDSSFLLWCVVIEQVGNPAYKSSAIFFVSED